MKKLIKIFLLVLAVLIYVTCFNGTIPEYGNITFVFGNVSARSLMANDLPWPPFGNNGDGDYDFRNELRIEITLTNESGDSFIIEGKASDTIKATVVLGKYLVSAKAFFDTEDGPLLYAVNMPANDIMSEIEIEVTLKDNVFKITMIPSSEIIPANSLFMYILDTDYNYNETKVLSPINKYTDFTIALIGYHDDFDFDEFIDSILDTNDIFSFNSLNNEIEITFETAPDGDVLFCHVYIEYDGTGEFVLGKAEIKINLSLPYEYPFISFEYNVDNIIVPIEIRDGLSDSDDRRIPVWQENIKTFNEYAQNEGLAKHYILIDDVNLDKNGDYNWQMIAPQGNLFSGSFFGNNKTISNIYMYSDNEDYISMFGNLSGKVYDLSLSDVTIIGNDYIGAIAGNSTGDIENCHVIGNSYVTGKSNVGGIVGINNGEITNSSFSVDFNQNQNNITGDENIGGIAGFNAKEIRYCFVNDSSYVYGNTETTTNIGGLAGTNTGTISNSYNAGTVGHFSRTRINIGGIAGNNKIEDSAIGTIENCFNEGSINSNSDSNSKNVGGIAGENSGIIQNCYNIHDVSGGDNVGGIVGNSNKGITANCYNTGVISGSKESVGGIVGKHDNSNDDIGDGNNIFIKNNVALNTYISDPRQGKRVVHNTANTQKNALSNNYARIDMLKNGYIPESHLYLKGHGFNDGKDISSNEWFSKSWWENTELENGPGFDPNIWEIVSGQLPILKNMPESAIQNPAVDLHFEGTGADTTPYLIKNKFDLYTFNTLANNIAEYRSVSYKLTDNITLDDPYQEDSNWTPIGNESNVFSGTFDGGGFYISNIIIDFDYDSKDENNKGLFGYIGVGGTVKNVGIIESSIKGGDNVGSIAGSNYGEIFNCYNKSEINGGGKVGGIAGRNAGIITNCYNTGEIKTNYGPIGGIVGDNTQENGSANGTILYCYNTSDISADSLGAGGITGWFSGGRVENCVSLGTSVSVTNVDTDNIGRIVYWFNSDSGTLNNNFANSDMTVNSQTISDGAIDNQNGADVDSDSYNDETWWEQLLTDTTPGPNWTINSSGSGNENSPWEWDGNTNLPKLWFE